MSLFLNNLTFSQARDYAIKGWAIQRKGWNGKRMFVAYTPPQVISPSMLWGRVNKDFYRDATTVETVDYMTLKMADDKLMLGWQPNPADMFTDDWQVIDPTTEVVLTEGELA